MTTEAAIKALADVLGPALDDWNRNRWSRDGMQAGAKHNASGTPQSSGYSHGPGGNLSYPGVRPDVFSTIVGNMGILSQLPAIPALDTNPLFTVLTAQGDKTGAEKSAVCDNAPVAGLLRACILTSQFARYERATPELEITRLGSVNDRADPMDLTLVNNPLFAGNHPFFMGPGDPNSGASILANEMQRKFRELGIELHRLINRQLWVGNPVNNKGDAYREFTSFAVQVNTGHTDAISGVACAAADADVKDFKSLRVDGSAANGTALVQALSYIYMTRKRFAETTGIDPVRWVFVMRPEVWFEITQVWPCSYLTYMCQVTGNQQVQINAADQVKFRDEMRSGRYLLVNGDRIDVVVDDGIAFLDGNSSAGAFPRGCISSDIFLIPMSVQGGRAVTYLEYKDYTNPSIAAAMAAADPGAYRVEGAFITFMRRLNQCIAFQSQIEPRLIMRTPWLAGRLKNVVICPLQFAPQPFPDNPYSLASSGVTSRSGPSYFDGTWKS